MTRRKPFQPQPVQSYRTDFDAALRQPTDRRDGEVYVYAARDEVVLAVNVALVTGRPLLVFGAAGSGKSTLASSIARTLNRRFYEVVISSRTQAQDLMVQFDVVRRLADAQAAAALPEAERLAFRTDLHRYLEPGVLWWAFDHDSALRRGAPVGSRATQAADPSRIGAAAAPAVVLIDEIDKADPDLPNNLLVALGSSSFEVREIATQVTAKTPPLIVITTNEERDLPSAFLRRCVTVRLPDPERESLVDIAEAHFGKDGRLLGDAIARRTVDLAASYRARGERPPSTAEFLDCVRACLNLGIGVGDSAFESVVAATLAKPETRGAGPGWQG